MNTQVVVFNGKNLNVLGKDNQFWLSSADIANALEYSGSNSITNLYNAHKEEFDQSMTEVIESMTSKNMSRRQRFFNREGAWLIGMFARTPKAAEFRKWVLKVLGAVADNQLPTVKVDMKAIGGMVKKCAAVAVRQELTNLLAGDKTEQWECSDQDLIYHLYRWHNTKSKAETLAFRQLYAERDALLAEITQLKEKAKQIKVLADSVKL